MAKTTAHINFNGTDVTVEGNMKPWRNSRWATNNCNMIVAAPVYDLNKKTRWALVAYFGTYDTLLRNKPFKADTRNRIIGFLPDRVQGAMNEICTYYPSDHSGSKDAITYGYYAMWHVDYNKTTGDYCIRIRNDRQHGGIPNLVEKRAKAALYAATH